MQFVATTRIGRAALQPGDLVFFGGGRVVGAPYSGSSVRVNSSALSRGDIAGHGRV